MDHVGTMTASTRAAASQDAEATPQGGAEGVALYLHVPFCATKCRYCDFNAYARMERLIPEFVQAILREIEAWSAILGPIHVPTIFFGGGTPSLLPPDDVARILNAAGRAFGVDPGAEVTLEANPDDLTEAMLRQLRERGVNRLSMGVQSFDDGLLRSLDRRHTADEAADAYRMAHAAGFENVNLDLIYGLCGQTLAQWEATLESAVSLRPEHLSLYALTVEEGTPLWDDVRRGRRPEPDPDLAADMYVMAEDRLDAAGYRHYEISNWALPGRACRHNLVYWLNQPYLGLGPGAHSRLGAYRFHDVLSPAQYVLRAGELPVAAGQQSLTRGVLRGLPTIAGVDEISAATDAADTLILGLRLDEGVDVDEVARRFPGLDVGRWDGAISEMREAGLLEREGGVLRLTRRGRLLGNEVFLRFLPSVS